MHIEVIPSDALLPRAKAILSAAIVSGEATLMFAASTCIFLGAGLEGKDNIEYQVVKSFLLMTPSLYVYMFQDIQIKRLGMQSPRA